MRDPMAALRAFRLVAEKASFTRAAAALEITPSALSQTLSQLEAHLDVRLLQRTTRRVGLTEAGRQLLARVAAPLGEIDAALEEARAQSGRPAGRLTVTSSRVAASAFVEPILPEFLRRYPEITLDLRIESNLADVIGQGIDVGIRFGERLEQDMICISLSGPVRSVVVAAPDYFRRHGRPAHPRDLAAHNCLQVRSMGGPETVYRWDFCENGRWFQVDVGGNLISNDSGLATRAALAGVGLRQTMLVDVQKHLADGRLESVLDSWLPPFDDFFLYYPSRIHLPAKLRVFIDCLLERGRAVGQTA